ncbi:MAG TPA: hypothetical protein VFQ22_12640 [Longimicrobiales bacterium]|nr:hypothetical protein [Longimicrobiales bacterium]
MTAPVLEAYRARAADARRSRPTWAVMTLAATLCAASACLAAFMLDADGASRLVEPPVADGAWQLAWSAAMRPPSAGQEGQVLALRRVAGGTAALISVLGLLTTIGLWGQRLRMRREEHYVHG